MATAMERWRLPSAKLAAWCDASSGKSSIVRQLAAEVLDAREQLALQAVHEERSDQAKAPSLALLVIERCGTVTSYAVNTSVKVVLEPFLGNVRQVVAEQHGEWWRGLLDVRGRTVAMLPRWETDPLQEIRAAAIRRLAKETDAAMRTKWIDLYEQATHVQRMERISHVSQFTPEG